MEKNSEQKASGDTVVPISEFEEIKLDKAGKVKIPRVRVHCSDGIYEEYSTDEEDEVEEPVDTSVMTWMPYLKHYTVVSATSALKGCDFLGEKLADFFGITSPKYGYILREAEREMKRKKEEEEEERKAEEEFIMQALKEKSQSAKAHEGAAEEENKV